MATSVRYINKLENQRVLILGEYNYANPISKHIKTKHDFNQTTFLRHRSNVSALLGGTSGIGYAVTSALVAHGSHVYISSSNAARVESTIERLKSTYPESTTEIRGHVCDLADMSTAESNIVALLNAATDNGKNLLNHVVFTAGDALQLPDLKEVTAEQIQKMGNVRFVGSVLLAKHLQSFLVPGSGSSYIMTGGTNTDKPAPRFAIVAGYGAAAEGLTRGLAVELAPRRVCLVSVGAVDTELLQRTGSAGVLKEQFAKETLVGRVADPSEVAEAYLYIMRDTFITGEVVKTHGGRLLV